MLILGHASVVWRTRRFNGDNDPNYSNLMDTIDSIVDSFDNLLSNLKNLFELSLNIAKKASDRIKPSIICY